MQHNWADQLSCNSLCLILARYSESQPVRLSSLLRPCITGGFSSVSTLRPTRFTVFLLLHLGVLCFTYTPTYTWENWCIFSLFLDCNSPFVLCNNWIPYTPELRVGSRLQDGRFRVRIPAGARSFPLLRTSRPALEEHPPSYSVSGGYFPGDKATRTGS